eukprot:329232_1
MVKNQSSSGFVFIIILFITIISAQTLPLNGTVMSGVFANGGIKNGRIGLFYIGIGKYNEKSKDRTEAVSMDIKNLMSLSNEINEIEIVNPNSFNRTSWTQQQFMDELGIFRKSLQKDELDGWIALIVGHGIYTGQYSTIKTSDGERVTYHTIKSFFTNAADLRPNTQHKPRLLALYSCKGKLVSTIDQNNEWNSQHEVINYEHQGYPTDRVSGSPSKNGINSANQVMAKMQKNQLLPNDNVYIIEGSFSPYSVKTGPGDCGTLPAMAIAHRLVSNDAMVYGVFAQGLINDIRFSHKYLVQRNIDPYSPNFSTTGDHIFILSKNRNNGMNIQISNLRNTVAQVFEKVEKAKKQEVEDAKRMKIFYDERLPGLITSTSVLHSFCILANGNRFVSINNFIDYFTKTPSIANQYITKENVIIVRDTLLNASEYKCEEDVNINKGIWYTIFEPMHDLFDSLKKMFQNESIKKLAQTNQLIYLNSSLESIKHSIASINNGTYQPLVQTNNDILKGFYDGYGKRTVMTTIVQREATRFGGVVFIIKYDDQLIVTSGLNCWLDSMSTNANISCESNDLKVMQQFVMASTKFDMNTKLNMITKLIGIDMFNINYLHLL